MPPIFLVGKAFLAKGLSKEKRFPMRVGSERSSGG